MIQKIDVAYSVAPWPEARIRKTLFELGHFHEVDDDGFVGQPATWEDIKNCDVTCQEFRVAVRSYQRMRPLLEDGCFGPRCEHQATVEVGRRCGCPDVMERRSDLSEWPELCQRAVTTAHEIDDLDMPDSQGRSIDEAWVHGVTRWNEVCGVVLSHIGSMSDARVRATADKLSGSILAWSYLPSNNCSESLAQKYNTRVRWSYQYLWTTITHEIGHAIGLGHGGSGIMKPYNDGHTVELGSWDVAQALKRYGKPTDVPTPPEPPTPPPRKQFGVLQWYRVDDAGKAIPVEEYDVLERATVPAKP